MATFTRSSRGDAETLIGVMRFQSRVIGEDVDRWYPYQLTRRPELSGVATKSSLSLIEQQIIQRLRHGLPRASDEALRADNESLGRSRYVVIFLSDGSPDEQ